MSIVPSLGFITALYAVSVAFWNALASTGASITVTVLISFVKPLKSCERITPELPRAPLNEPPDIAFDKFSKLGVDIALTSLAAERIVIVMFVPVSPSGTGNTFNSLIISFFASRLAAPAKKHFLSMAASMVLIATVKSSLNNG